MESRDFGRTGLRVSALGFGCGAVGGLMVRGDHAEQREAVATALNAGVTYFDTAPSYGDGASETNLGRVLTELRAHDRVVVGTKVMFQPNQLREPTRAARESVETSLRRLRRDQADVVYLHNVIDEETGRGEVREALQELVVAGLARHIGFTAVGETAMLKQTLTRYEAAQCYLNVLDPSGLRAGANGGQQDFDGLIEDAAKQGVAVVAIRIYAAGALSATPDRHPIAWLPPRPLIPGSEYADDLGRAQGFQTLARELDMESPLELSLRFVLGPRAISTVLVGLSTVEHLRSALRWAERGPMDEAEREYILELASR
jgi:aryl-alcohol dehydrogenase-like predicted oxidoreductase